MSRPVNTQSYAPQGTSNNYGQGSGASSTAPSDDFYQNNRQDFNPMNHNGESSSQGPSQLNERGYDSYGYNPQDRNANYRHKVASNRRFMPNKFPKMAPTNFKKKIVNYRNNISQTVNNAIQSSSLTNANTRTKGFSVAYKRVSDESLKVILNKISDDLQINLKDMKGLGFSKEANDKNLLTMFFNEQHPYTKIVEKMELQDIKLIDEGNLDNLTLIYEGPRSLSTPLISGEIFASVRGSETHFPLKLSKPDGIECKMFDALSILEEWQKTRHEDRKYLIEEITHSIRVSRENIVITLNDVTMRDDLQDLLSRIMSPFVVTTNVRPTVISISQGATPRVTRNALKATPEMLKVFETIGNMTPNMLNWCKMISSGNYALVELSNETDIENTTARLRQTSIDAHAMDIDQVRNDQLRLPTPISPLMNQIG